MALLPILFSTERSLIDTYPTLSTYGMAVVAGDRYRYSGSLWLCTQSGTTGGFSSSTYDNAMSVLHDDAVAPNVLSTGTAKFIDITGNPNYGWGAASWSIYSLFTANNETTTSTVGDIRRPNQGMNTVYFDSDSVIYTGSNLGNRGGLAMWRYYDAINELVWGTGVPLGYTIGHPTADKHITYVSVDASLPDMPTKKGAVINITDQIYACRIGGFGTVIGMVFNIEGITTFSGAQCTICHIWFEDCEFHVRKNLDTVVEGRLDGSVGSQSTLVDIMFRKTPMAFYAGATYTVGGKVCFEDTEVSRDTDTVAFMLGLTYTQLSFVAVDFSGMQGGSPYLGVGTTYAPMTEVRYEGCTGLEVAKIRPITRYGDATYRIEVVGGELDGVVDTSRYLLFTELYDMELVNYPYALSSTSEEGHGLSTLRITTTGDIQPGFNYCTLHTFVTWATPGIYEVSVRLLVPEGTVLNSTNLWVDFSSTGDARGVVNSSYGTEGILVEDDGNSWVKPYGWVAYRVTILTAHDLHGHISATLYCAVPDTSLYVSGSLHTLMVAQYE